MTAEMSVQITLALFFFFNPSAGIGRQDNLKIY